VRDCTRDLTGSPTTLPTRYVSLKWSFSLDIVFTLLMLLAIALVKITWLLMAKINKTG